MRQNNYKVDKIKRYINETNPTRSQLIKHIVVEINGKVSEDFFDRNHREFRGYYATNIGTMRKKGNIWSKNGKYYVTKQGMNDEHSLYRKTKVEELKDEVKRLKNHVNWERNKKQIAQEENWKLKSKIREVKTVLDKIN